VADVTEPQQPGSKQMPDFKELNDRMIADRPEGPFLAIKTNLDSKDATEDNPYYENKEQTNKQAFLDFFKE
jgi:hypothetical protein